MHRQSPSQLNQIHSQRLGVCEWLPWPVQLSIAKYFAFTIIVNLSAVKVCIELSCYNLGLQKDVPRRKKAGQKPAVIRIKKIRKFEPVPKYT